MKKTFAAALVIASITASTAMAYPMHHRHRICQMNHHHRVCYMR